MMDRQDDCSSNSLDGDIALSRDALARRPSYRKILDDLSGGIKHSDGRERGDSADASGSMTSNLDSNDDHILIPMGGGFQIGTLGGQSMFVSSGSGIGDDTSGKRQIRLLKNRMAAKECRRKKKEYVKCLENRVAVLENQNKALIEELKSLKELYCQKDGLTDSPFVH